MHTGHVAMIDDDGYGNIVGRIKDMVIPGGENIYPREVEEFLYAHPKVRDVQVIGTPDPKLGEELCAWIITQGDEAPTEAEISDYCRPDRALQDSALCQVRGKLSHDGDRKIQKFLIRATMKTELGIDEAKTA